MLLSITDSGIKYDFNADQISSDVGLGLSNIKTRIQQVRAEFSHMSKNHSNIIELKIYKEYGN